VVALATGLVAFAVPAAALDVLMRSPRPGTAAFGEVAIEAEVLSAEPIAEVVFRVDGRQVGRLTAPPWKLEVDVGSDNAGHLRHRSTSRTSILIRPVKSGCVWLSS
jgi:hypothetical protein